jgi:hypothetical protein
VSACYSECDCGAIESSERATASPLAQTLGGATTDADVKPASGPDVTSLQGISHDPDCRSLDVCDGERGSWCEKHWQEQLYTHGWMRHVSIGAVTGRMSETDKQGMHDAGRGHLVAP